MDLHVRANGNFSSVKYQDEILRAIVGPYPSAVGLPLVQDNDWPHVARICEQFLDSKGTDAFDSPSPSLDFNPIGRLWDVMYRHIQRHPVPPDCCPDPGLGGHPPGPQSTNSSATCSAQTCGGHTHY